MGVLPFELRIQQSCVEDDGTSNVNLHNARTSASMAPAGLPAIIWAELSVSEYVAGGLPVPLSSLGLTSIASVTSIYDVVTRPDKLADGSCAGTDRSQSFDYVYDSATEKLHVRRMDNGAEPSPGTQHRTVRLRIKGTT